MSAKGLPTIQKVDAGQVYTDLRKGLKVVDKRTSYPIPPPPEGRPGSSPSKPSAEPPKSPPMLTHKVQMSMDMANVPLKKSDIVDGSKSWNAESLRVARNSSTKSPPPLPPSVGRPSRAIPPPLPVLKPPSAPTAASTDASTSSQPENTSANSSGNATGNGASSPRLFSPPRLPGALPPTSPVAAPRELPHNSSNASSTSSTGSAESPTNAAATDADTSTSNSNAAVPKARVPRPPPALKRPGSASTAGPIVVPPVVEQQSSAPSVSITIATATAATRAVSPAAERPREKKLPPPLPVTRPEANPQFISAGSMSDSSVSSSPATPSPAAFSPPGPQSLKVCTIGKCADALYKEGRCMTHYKNYMKARSGALAPPSSSTSSPLPSNSPLGTPGSYPQFGSASPLSGGSVFGSSPLDSGSDDSIFEKPGSADYNNTRPAGSAHTALGKAPMLTIHTKRVPIQPPVAIRQNSGGGGNSGSNSIRSTPPSATSMQSDTFTPSSSIGSPARPISPPGRPISPGPRDRTASPIPGSSPTSAASTQASSADSTRSENIVVLGSSAPPRPPRPPKKELTQTMPLPLGRPVSPPAPGTGSGNASPRTVSPEPSETPSGDATGASGARRPSAKDRPKPRPGRPPPLKTFPVMSAVTAELKDKDIKEASSPVDDRSPSPTTREKRQFDLAMLLEHPLGRELFTQQLKQEHSEENILFWQHVLRYKRMKNSEQKEQAQYIVSTFIASGAERQVNIHSDAQRGILEAMAADKITPTIFDDAHKEVFMLMRKDPFRRFMLSDLYKQFMADKDDYERKIEADNKEKLKKDQALFVAKTADVTRELSYALGLIKLKPSGIMTNNSKVS